MRSTFFRAHGLGNDYLVWEGDPAVVSPAWVQRVCDRHAGVGSDGVLVPGPGLAAGAAETSVRIFNPDGSEAEKSGNGVRIYALWWSRRAGVDRFRVGTAGGIVGVRVYEQDGECVAAEMGIARLGEPEPLAGVVTWPVNVGNPHRVVLHVPPDWCEVGARIEVAVPGRTNVQFVEVLGLHHVRARVWERGAGRTLASGSSACAVARVVTSLGLCTSPVQVEMEGGTLRVDVDAAGGCTIDGRVVAIGHVELDPRW